MSPIAEGFILRLAAPTECILFLQGVSLNFPPGTAVALIIVANFRGIRGTAPVTIYGPFLVTVIFVVSSSDPDSVFIFSVIIFQILRIGMGSAG